MDKVQLYFKSKIQVYRQILANLENFELTATSKPIQEYKTKCQKKMGDLVTQLFLMFDKYLSPLMETTEDKVFIEKSKADYTRYMAEVDSSQKWKDDSKGYYEKAIELATTLGKSQKTQLGLMLNYSVFLYNIMNEQQTAISIARSTKEAWLETRNPEGDDIIEILDNNLQDWEQKDNDLDINDV